MHSETPEYAENPELPEDLLDHLENVHHCILPLPEFIPDK